MDLASVINVTAHHFPAVRTATPTEASFDMATAALNGATIIVQVGAGGITFTGTNKLEIVFSDSDDGTNWAVLTTGELKDTNGADVTLTSGIGEAYVAAKAAASVTHYEYAGGRRYLRVTPTYGGTHATGTLTGVLIVGHSPAVAPLA